MNSNEVVSISYHTISSESTLLRCCLAADEFRENSDACAYETETVKTYELNQAGDCIETTCDRIDTYLPNDGLSRDLIFYKEGEECTPTGSTTVEKDICCIEAELGCGRTEMTPPEYTTGSCNNDECSDCSLTYHSATNYFNDANEQINRIVDYKSGTTTEDSVQVQPVCCAAGIQLDDPDLIRACIVDGGAADPEYELTDRNECIKRETRFKSYQDAESNKLPGYDDFIEVTEGEAEIISADECCE